MDNIATRHLEITHMNYEIKVQCHLITQKHFKYWTLSGTVIKVLNGMYKINKIWEHMT